jgi:RNA polymerase sigma-70 factor (ECF subfamily)
LSTELVIRARDGDRHAFEVLIATRLDRLYRLAALLISDHALAEDALQEGLIRAWRSLPRLRDAARFDAWLRRVVVHACTDAGRRARTSRRERALSMEVAAEGDFTASVAQRDALTRAYARLTPEHRAVFVLRHHLGLSIAEIAEAVRIREGTVKSRLHYAEKSMVAALEADARQAAAGGLA